MCLQRELNSNLEHRTKSLSSALDRRNIIPNTGPGAIMHKYEYEEKSEI